MTGTRRFLVVVAFAMTVLVLPKNASTAVCSIPSVSPVAFGAYDVLASNNVDSTGSITINCTSVVGGDTVIVTLSTGGSGTYSPRKLASGANLLSYNLYLDAARTTVWGDTTGGTSQYGPQAAVEGNTSLTVYGRIPALQSVPAGSYADTIVVTLQY